MEHSLVWLARHGETEWSRDGRHTGLADIPLTPLGEDQARALAAPLEAIEFDRVLCSPLGRALRTCQLAGLGDRAELRDDLVEWNYGDYEGITSAEIRESAPGWLLWRDGCPNGESPAEVGARVDVVVRELADPDREGRSLAVFSHGHLLRVLAARWIGLEVAAGQVLGLETGTLSRLGWEHDYRVIDRWNAPAD